MALQDEMFGLVENWKESKLPKSTFILRKLLAQVNCMVTVLC